MNLEAIQLQSWYATRLGRITVQLVGDVMERWLKSHRVEKTFGFGFTQPYLERVDGWTDGLLGMSPAEMGVAHWPPGGKNRIALTRPDALPCPNNSFDRVIMTHLLEGTESPTAALRETWRILKPGGRLCVMVPNRGGVWARRDITPFGWGRPFSPRQLRQLLEEALFIPCQARFALYMPPWENGRLLKTARAWEKAGNRWFPFLGGAILCEAEKVVYASTPLRSVEERLKRQGWALPATERRS
ncbi:methyltransferase domain-containing protein [Magnetococcales bacterium HHB-1]